MSPKSAMQEVIKMNSGLTFHGMGVYQSSTLTYGNFLKECDHTRKLLFIERALDAFITAVQWLDKPDNIKGIPKEISSYSLKHIIERSFRENPKCEKDRHFYLSNGTCIAAVIASGFPCTHHLGSPNVMCDLSKRTFRKLDIDIKE